MKHYTYKEFLRAATVCADYARTEPVSIGDDVDAPDLVLMPHEIYRQLRQGLGERQAVHVSQLPPELKDAIMNHVGDAENKDTPEEDRP